MIVGIHLKWIFIYGASPSSTSGPQKHTRVWYSLQVVTYNKIFRHPLCASDSVSGGPTIRHFSLLNVNAAGACGYDFLCDGGRLVRAYVRLRRGAI